MTEEKLKEIEEYAKKMLENGKDPQHDYKHLETVRKNALEILKILGIKNIDTNLLQAVCLLHDVPISIYPHGPMIRHFFEKLAIRKYLPGILADLKIEGDERDIITKAIMNHPFTVPYGILNKKGDTYAKVMQDADSLDFLSKEREASLSKAKEHFLFYFLTWLVSGKFFPYGRSRAEKYLNYPELKNNWNF